MIMALPISIPELIEKRVVESTRKDSICNQGIDKYLFAGAFYIMTDVIYITAITAYLFRSSAPGYLVAHLTTLRQSLRSNA